MQSWKNFFEKPTVNPDQKTVEPSDLKETLALISLTLYNFIAESNIKSQE